jgi:hypothetical protein
LAALAATRSQGYDPATSATAENNAHMNDQQRIELEAAAFRRLVQHLRSRPDVQNIDLMNLAGFCRNCLSKWYKAAADDLELAVSLDEAREEVYGMPYAEWKKRYQKEASPDQQAAFEKTHKP